MNKLKYAGIVIAVLAVLAVGMKIGDWWRARGDADQIAALKIQLGQSQETLEIANDLYAKKVVAYENLGKYLEYKTDEMKALQKQLEDTKAQLLTAEQITLRWKKAYEAAVAAQQSEEPNPDPSLPPRKRVDFSGRLGPIQATGHTLTDPPEAFLKLEQVDPLKLTIVVAQNKDKSWSTYVTSSDENVGVSVDLASVNPLVLSPKWYQRLWLDLGVAVLGDPAGYVGASWRGDKYSFGAMCYASDGSMNGCGVTVGARIFK